MPGPRKRIPSNNLLAPQDPQIPSSPTSASRSTSPSGFTTFLSKPAKWFSRSPSSTRVNATLEQPRPSTGARKPRISQPSDPRQGPLAVQAGMYINGASKSVYDVSRVPLDTREPFPSNLEDLGDLRNISRKGWSRSADDLSNFPSSTSSPNIAPINVEASNSFRDLQLAKIEEYRSNSPRSPGFPKPAPPPRSNSSPNNGSTVGVNFHPFPTSSTPPDQAIGMLSSISSAPALVPPPPPRTHARSLSLSKPKAVPTSPRNPLGLRKTSGSFERETEKAQEKEKDREREHRKTLVGGSPFTGRAGFPFHKVGGPPIMSMPSTTHKACVPSPATSPASTPPAIVEPDSEHDHERRTSQIIYYSGFINRQMEFSMSSPTVQGPKGWKPFKLVLKGSKLYFYKPPSDRSAGIRDLFPLGLVAVLEDALEGAVPSEHRPDSEQKKERDDGGSRRKRVYWGRGTHPKLVLSGGTVHRGKGNFEALVHEAVFATTFGLDVESESASGDNLERKAAWQDFASAVVLALPRLVGQDKFENEFTRCGAYLVSGASEDVQERERERLAWLAGQYLRYNNHPADSVSWDQFRESTIPSLLVPEASFPSSSSSMQALYSDSPDLGTFSPRPPHSDHMPLFTPTHSPGSTLAPATPPRRSSLDNRAPNLKLWAALEQESLTREIFLRLEAPLVARSLYVFFRQVFEGTSDNLTLDTCLGDPQHDASLSSLFGSDEQPHWLTNLVVGQILGPGENSSRSARQSLSSKTHTRSEAITAWTKVGELCRITGNECAWKAIMAAVCSRPVARLEKAWKRADPQAVTVVEAWVHPSADGQMLNVNEPRTTPWGGQVRDRIKQALDRAGGADKEDEWLVEPMKDARLHFEELRTSFSLCPRKPDPALNSVDGDVQKLVQLWRRISSGAEGPHLMAMNKYLSLSIAAEPRRKGRFEPSFWSRAPSSHTSQSLVPLLFPEPLPTTALVNRQELARARVDSGPPAPVQTIRVEELTMQPKVQQRRTGGRTTSLDMRSAGLGSSDLGGAVIPIFDGELLLLCQQQGEWVRPSRPTSGVDMDDNRRLGRLPSIRLTQGSTGLDHKPSRSPGRRSSLPSISQRTSLVVSESSSELPLRVVVKAGTLDRLVDVLAHDLKGVTVSVADDNGEIPLREQRTREVKVDIVEFSKIWWNVFRSFVTPLVFFELLRKRFVIAQTSGSSETLLRTARIRTQILEVLNEWIVKGGGAQDALDNGDLFDAMHSFLSHSTDPLDLSSEEADVHDAWAAAENVRSTLLQTFTSHTRRPRMRTVINQETNGTPRKSLGGDPPDIDRCTPDELVDNLDAIAGATFHNITEEDLFVTSDLLEIQSADRTGWYLPRDPSSAHDEVDIQTLYSQVLEVEPSTLITELGYDTLYRLLPPGIRSSMRAYGIVSKWLASRIASCGLGLQRRQARMELLLRALEVTRLRSTRLTTSDVSPIEQPCIRSFVEAVLTSSVLSVESRMYQRAWMNVATTRGVGCDSLLILLAGSKPVSTHSDDSLTADTGWFLERMLEVISLPDVIDSPAQETQPLVNFDKRRNLHNLIVNASSFSPPRLGRRDADRQNFERLNNMEKDCTNLQSDYRTIKEDAYRESIQPASSVPYPSSKKSLRPFRELVSTQQEKNKRDKTLRERLSREKRHEQQRLNKREDDLNKAMQARRLGTPRTTKQTRNKKAMSMLFHVMRPISSAFTSDNTPSGTSPKRSMAELDFAPTHKPSLVLSVADAQIGPFQNGERAFTFSLDTEDGGRYLLQAVSGSEMTKWIETIGRMGKIAAQRRLTYVGNSPKPQLSDHIPARPTTTTHDPTAVFGVDLEFLLLREADGHDVPPGTIPSVIDRCLTEIESRGLTEVGIYRIAGATTELNGLKDALNNGGSPINSSTDIHAVCDLVKSWLRVLPQPVFPPSSYHEVISAIQLDDLDSRLSKIRDVVHDLPRANFDLLKRIVEHLDKVTDFEEHNQMTADALAIVFSPNLLRAPNHDFSLIMQNMGHTHKIVKALINHFHVIFDDSDAEAEAEAEAEADPEEYEYEEAIMEVDEEDEEELEVPQHESDNSIQITIEPPSNSTSQFYEPAEAS